MALEFRHDELVVRVDGDIAEIFCRGAFSHRLLLAWLAVQVQPSIRGHLVVAPGGRAFSSGRVRPSV